MGSYTISAALSPAAALSNYTITYNSAPFTITRAVLTAAAVSTSQVYGAPPVLSSTVTGFVNGDTSAVVSGAPVLTTTATSTSLPGTYPITVSLGTLAASNYTFTLINGIDTVTFTAAAPGRNGICNGAYNGIYRGDLHVTEGEVCIFVNGGVTGDIHQDGGTVELIGSSVGHDMQVQGGNFSVTDGSEIHGNLQIQAEAEHHEDHPGCWNHIRGDGQPGHQGSDGVPDCPDDTFHGHMQFNPDGVFTVTNWSDLDGELDDQNPQGWATNLVCGSTIGGDLQFQHNGMAVLIGAGAPASCPRNMVKGNLQVQDNTAPVSVVGNTVGRDLTVQHNSSATIVNGNTVQGNLMDNDNKGATQVFQDTVGNGLLCEDNLTISGGNDTARIKRGQCSQF